MRGIAGENRGRETACRAVSGARFRVSGTSHHFTKGDRTGIRGTCRMYQETDRNQEQCGSHHDLSCIHSGISGFVLSWVGDTLVFSGIT
jgi:hypothetical protein